MGSALHLARDPQEVRSALWKAQKKISKLDDLEFLIFADSVAFFVRNGFPRGLVYRLAEKYQPVDELVDADVALERLDLAHENIVEVFAELDIVSRYESCVDEELRVLDFVAGASPPNSNRFAMAKALGIPVEQASAIATRLLDGGFLHIAEVDGVLQLSLTKNRARLFEYAKEKKGFDERKHGNLLHKCISKDNKVIEKIGISNYVYGMSLDEIIRELDSLDEKRHELVKSYIKAVKAESSMVDIPESPPNNKYYKGKEIDGDIVDFINEVYGEYMDGINFGRKELAECDPKAGRALNSHEARYGKVSLARLPLPTIAQKNEALVAGLTARQMVAAHSTMQTSKRRNHIKNER